MDLIDKVDLGQQCAVQFINANGKEWVNRAEGEWAKWKSAAVFGGGGERSGLAVVSLTLWFQDRDWRLHGEKARRYFAVLL